MNTRVAAQDAQASRATPVGGNTTPTSGSDPDSWFCLAAREALGDNDTGLLLHYLTGYPQSSCYAYVTKDASKRRPPPEHLLRKLCHSDQGEPWLRAFMGGCTAPWWVEFQHAVKIKRAIDSVK